MADRLEPSVTAKLSQEALQIEDTWYGDTGTQRSVAFHSLSLGGSVGQLQAIIHQIEVGNVDPTSAGVRFDMVNGLSQVYHDLLVMAALTGTDLEKALVYWRGNVNSEAMSQRKQREAKRNGAGH